MNDTTSAPRAVRFYGRSRSTGEGGPRERQVVLSDGTRTWAEEGSILWDEAAGAEGRAS